ncbi:hypothetical protein DICSQDRAFT_133225 [Dichomitus squalens LYAD-421 SS1]|uniref:uncharacterized protein n=1 Tax=Dichomitus squalens (strain LYAD-421) TaxID=732165 RepID=UPI0004411D4F|nr:uncharacterized protein DICSQDRAFT_133225 [Dichomitus squalens LYAD-421 SS1]EJF65616.1 hypothetical protein DICSQDRAFT_133225 [Dichomitus squalens LYAD-421 SS1]
MEKNDDDRLQDLLYQLRSITADSVHADVALEVAQEVNVDVSAVVHELPSQEEAASDASSLLHSIYTLAYVLLTSAAFRVILSDVLLIARQAVADVAARVGNAAATVENIADDIEETVRPGGGTVEEIRWKASEAVDNITDGALEGNPHDYATGSTPGITEQIQQAPDKMKEAVIRQLQDAVARAHRQPSFRSALRTILNISRKYAMKVRAASEAFSDASAPVFTLTPVVWADPPVSRALENLRILLERMSSGYDLSYLLSASLAVITDIVAAPAEALSESESKVVLRTWFGSLGDWLDCALRDPKYVTSETGCMRIEQLYDLAHKLVQDAEADPESHWVQHVRTFLAEVDSFISALGQDRTTNELIKSLSDLATSVADAGADFRASLPGALRGRASLARREALQSFALWLLPRILRVASAIPMPRIEYVDSTIEAVIDAILLTAPRHGVRGEETLGVQSSLVPDRVSVQSWNEVVLDIDNTIVLPQPGPSLLPSLAGTLEQVGLAEAVEEGPPLPASKIQSQTTRTSVSARTRTRVHVEGVRVSAHDVAYYMLYKGARCCGLRVPFTSYEDEGLISVDVGNLDPDPSRGGTGTGLVVDVELEFDSGAAAQLESNSTWLSLFTSSDPGRAPSAGPLFKVTDVHVDVRGLHIDLARTRHAILNGLFVRPLAGPSARAAVAWVLSEQIRTALESLAQFGGKVRESALARQGAGSSKPSSEGAEDGSEESAGAAEAWWGAFLEELGLLGSAQGQPGLGDDEGTYEDEDGDEETPLVETHTRATARGVIRTTVIQDSASTGADPEESVLAVGIGPQILPGKGGPYSERSSQDSDSLADDLSLKDARVRATEEARDAAGEVTQAQESAEESLRADVEQVVQMREEITGAEARGEVRTRVERKKKGWRSAAFDLW